MAYSTGNRNLRNVSHRHPVPNVTVHGFFGDGMIAKANRDQQNTSAGYHCPCIADGM